MEKTQKRVLLITGASSGIGAAASRLGAAQGYQVVLAARRMERLQSLADEIRAAGGTALPVEADLSQPDQIAHLAQAALDEFGQIDVLFNNAGFGRLNWLENLDPQDDIEAVIRVNLLGVIHMTQAVLPHMIARRSGHIINMSSIAGLVATPTYSVYAASKFGVRGFTEALRREVGVYGIRVSGIYPGGTQTEFDQHAGIRRKTKKTTPAALRLSAEEVAQAVLRLDQHPARMQVMPWPMWAAVWLNRLWPSMMDWFINEQFVKPERLGE